MSCLRVSVVLCVDGVDLKALTTIILGKEVFGGELKLVMKRECVEEK